MEERPIRLAVAGLGGFADAHHRALARLESEGLCEVVATCDPALPLTPNMVERGVAFYPSLGDLLDAHKGDLDLVTLPIPVPLHAEMHRAVVDSGLACYLEKPPTLWWPEFLSMLDVEKSATKATQVGFNFVSDPMRQVLKARILAGEFGRLLGATFLASWPRDRHYYQRAPWAGRIRLGDKWVLDNPIGNAMAHYVQNALFWCGTGSVDHVAEVESVRARLERYRPIQSFDTVFLEAKLIEGAWLRIAATHAATGDHLNEETIHLESATISLDSSHRATVRWNDGSVEQIVPTWADTQESLVANLRRYMAYLRGKVPRPTTTLEDCRGFVSLIDLAFAASPIQDRSSGEDPEWVSVPGMTERMREFIAAPCDLGGTAYGRDLDARWTPTLDAP